MTLTMIFLGISAFPCSRCGLFITSEVQHACRPTSRSAAEQIIAPATAALLLHIDSLRYRERGRGTVQREGERGSSVLNGVS